MLLKKLYLNVEFLAFELFHLLWLQGVEQSFETFPDFESSFYRDSHPYFALPFYHSLLERSSAEDPRRTSSRSEAHHHRKCGTENNSR